MDKRNYSKLLILTLLLALIVFLPAQSASKFASLWQYLQPHKISQRSQQFIDVMLPHIKQANGEVNAEREKLLTLYDSRRQLTAEQYAWLQQLQRRYAIKASSEIAWEQLLRRVDILPNALVLAQAINESAWGQSRFAKQGHNYFGVWCSTPGCGIVPKQRANGATYEVKTYPSVLDSVRDYLRIINTKRAYARLRELRRAFRINNKKLDALSLSKGLASYSSRGVQYVTSLNNLIHKYRLERWD